MLVMVEYFSKWIEFVALPQAFVELAAVAFLDRVLVRFGASAQVLMSEGSSAMFLKSCVQRVVTIPPCKIIWRWMAWLNGLFRQPGLRKYELLRGTTEIGTLCCHGLLWAMLKPMKNL